MDREELVAAMAEKLADVLDWMPSKFPRSMLTEAARAALAVAEPVVFCSECHTSADSAAPEGEEPTPKLHWGQRRITTCQADDDGYCDWRGCPQKRDGEPYKSRRHCPLDRVDYDDDF